VSHFVPRPWSAPCPGRPVVLGDEPDQNPSIVTAAAHLAQAAGTGLVCVWVDSSHVLVEREADGSLDLTPVDPDRDEESDEPPDGNLAERLAGLLDPIGLPWRYVYAVGETSRGLSVVADGHDALLIAVGTRRPGFGGWMNELIGGSVAGHLAHTQHRPVVMVPPPHRHENRHDQYHDAPTRDDER
jgi:nucleotide-binding universal stress UspA family protein